MAVPITRTSAQILNPVRVQLEQIGWHSLFARVAVASIWLVGCKHMVTQHWSLSSGRGDSMAPSFISGTRFLFERFSWRNTIPLFRRKLKIGDVVAYTSPINAKDLYLKRIVAMEGDKVNGVAVPAGCIWVEGDNKEVSPGWKWASDSDLVYLTSPHVEHLPRSAAAEPL